MLDLDDTLYKEIDFVASGFRAVLSACGQQGNAQLLKTMLSWQSHGVDVFDRLAQHLGTPLSASNLHAIYTEHEPEITLAPGAQSLIDAAEIRGAGLALLTDGRSVTQRNKITSLGLDGRFGCVIVSEEVGFGKPDERGFRLIERSFPDRKAFAYIADNPAKDFIAPNNLGWTTIQLDDDGRNIHTQVVPVRPEAAPKFQVSSFADIRPA